MTVSIPVIDHLDLDTKHIYLLDGCREYHPVEDIYAEIRRLRADDESLRVFDIPVKAEGAVPKGGGKYTPRYAVFTGGWRVVPEDVPHSLYISGEQITDDGQSGPACIDTSTLTSSVIIQYEPPAAEIIRDEESLKAIEDMSFNGGVTIDIDGGMSGTEYPSGNSQYFVNNIKDAVTIALNRRKRKFFINHDIVLDADAQMSGYDIIGTNALDANIEVLETADVSEAKFTDCSLTGVLDGVSLIQNSSIYNVSNITGIAHQVQLMPGTISLAQGTWHLIDSSSGLPGTDTPEIDFNGDGCSLGARAYSGGLLLKNKTGPDPVSIDLASGQVKIDMATVTNGTIVIRGDGKCVDSVTGEHIWSGNYGNLVIVNEANSAASHAIEIFSHQIEQGYRFDEFNRIMMSAMAGKVSGADSEEITFMDVNDTKQRIVATVDQSGNRTSVTLDGS